jgi:hypothetical protein
VRARRSIIINNKQASKQAMLLQGHVFTADNVWRAIAVVDLLCH